MIRKESCKKRGIQKKRGHQLSFVGRGFFSCVSVFFSLDLSNFSTSARSGLSLIVAVSLRKDGTSREMINIIHHAKLCNKKQKTKYTRHIKSDMSVAFISGKGRKHRACGPS